eukprot:4447210-Pyramimonas_sp.AAC.2
MTSARRLSPKVHLALQYLISFNAKIFRAENAVAVGRAENFQGLPPVTHADSCSLVHYDNDLNP